jgi:hypothetical protein
MKKEKEKLSVRYSYAAAVKKTMFFLVFVDGTKVAPYLSACLIASLWLLWH